jgi:hypothetical protein
LFDAALADMEPIQHAKISKELVVADVLLPEESAHSLVPDYVVVGWEVGSLHLAPDLGDVQALVIGLLVLLGHLASLLVDTVESPIKGSIGR